MERSVRGIDARVRRYEVTLRSDKLHPQRFKIEKVGHPTVSVTNKLMSEIFVRCRQRFGANEHEDIRNMARVMNPFAIAAELRTPVRPDRVCETNVAALAVATDDRIPALVTCPAQRIDIWIIQPRQNS